MVLFLLTSFSLYLLVNWAWWDWPLTWLTNHRPSVLWRCWLGHLTRKIVSEMTYNVSTWTLNPTIPSPILSIGKFLVVIRCSARSGSNERYAVAAPRCARSRLHYRYGPLSSLLLHQFVQRSVARQADLLSTIVARLLCVGRRPTAAAQGRLSVCRRKSVWYARSVRIADCRRRTWVLESPAVLHGPPHCAVRVYSHRRVHRPTATHRQLEPTRDEGQGRSRDAACRM